MKVTHLLFCLFITLTANAEGIAYGDAIANCPESLTRELAKREVPNAEGAHGRNKSGYFHARFQFGIHRLVDFGLCAKQTRAVDLFLSAAEYSFRHQLDDGDFLLKIPSALKGQGEPSLADRASGVAFFSYSLGAGIYALETSDWFQNSDECEPLRKRLSALKSKLPATLSYLGRHRKHLAAADLHAPNRQLFDAIAFYTLGKTLDDDEAIRAASSFVDSAIRQVDEDGYFIEGGGFDSSYNGVATALCFRLLLMGYKSQELYTVCPKTIRWQLSRISKSGEILTDRNSRVNPDGKGESFLGRIKDVDVAHTIEALLLASIYMGDGVFTAKAARVFDYYSKQGKDSR